MSLELPSLKCRIEWKEGTPIIGCASSFDDCPKTHDKGYLELGCFDPAIKRPVSCSTDAEMALVEIADILRRLNRARADC